MIQRYFKIERFIQFCLTVAFLFAFVGCFREVLLTPKSLQSDTENDIIVALKDGRRVNFENNSYRVIDANGQQKLEGKGKAYRSGSSQTSSFDGNIALADIESIKTSEKTTMFYVAIIGSGLAVGYAVLWLIALNGKGFGG